MNNMVVDNLNIDIIKNIPSTVLKLSVKGNYRLTKSDYDNLVVYTNVNEISVYDVCNFEYGSDIKINTLCNVEFKTDRFKKLIFDKANGYTKNSLTITLPFNVDEKEDFNKLINYIKDINILNINLKNEDLIDDIFSITYKLENKIGKKINFINVVTGNKTINNIEKLKFLEDNRIIKIWYEDGIIDCSIEEFINMRKKLDEIIIDVKNKNLSNFEKVIYVYDIVKKFKFVKPNDFYTMDGRHLHKIFNSNSLVCSGFARIITEILNELGINSSIYKLTTRDNILHARSLVHIVDAKYNINGIFSMEPTWESSINDTYAYSLFLTPVDKLRKSFPKEQFYGDIDVLTGLKSINDVSLKMRISLYKLFNNFDLCQSDIDKVIGKCNNNINLSCFINALVNVRCSQGFNRNVIVSNINNIIKYNGELTNYLNNKMETNLNFFEF